MMNLLKGKELDRIVNREVDSAESKLGLNEEHVNQAYYNNNSTKNTIEDNKLKNKELESPLLKKERERRLSNPAIEAAKRRAAEIQSRGIIKQDKEEEIPEEELKKYDAETNVNKELTRPIDLDTAQRSEMKLSYTATQALKMLGQGVKPSLVSTALNVSPAYISELMSDDTFSRLVTERKITTLTKANERDEALDNLEDTVRKKLETAIHYSNKPLELARVFQILNGAKRRGSGQLAESDIENTATVVTLTLPSAARAILQINNNNQVTSTGDQQLGAIDPRSLMELHRTGRTIEGSATRLDLPNVKQDSLRVAIDKAQESVELPGESNINNVSLDDL